MSLLRGDNSTDFQGRLPRIINRLIIPETANSLGLVMPPGLLVTMANKKTLDENIQAPSHRR